MNTKWYLLQPKSGANWIKNTIFTRRSGVQNKM